ncbi:hypothetical protein RFN52_36505 [Streptomyces collinus]|uniref:Uncharacterized protein n=1 Tax=Streptomyces collinus TaxID=42684 RepID=A0AA89Q762_STRCU|nr:hypothetical protein [Streptomyces collinus]MBB5815647.1 hypothetical protein [Streptomyces collinus]WMX69548.1 hypothetical protein RFN52_36505 [Streptomyces collinus]
MNSSTTLASSSASKAWSSVTDSAVLWASTTRSNGPAVWLFSSGPLDPSASERDIPPAPGVQRVMNRIGPRGHVTFGGRLTWATMVTRDLAVSEG